MFLLIIILIIFSFTAQTTPTYLYCTSPQVPLLGSIRLESIGFKYDDLPDSWHVIDDLDFQHT